MSASADKIQFLLQSSLQQTLPLVKKGIFSEQELRYIMLQRQKHQNKLYSSTYKLSHYLKAIEYEYQLERKRIYIIKNQQSTNVNPLFKKNTKMDFSIIKRIIKLWDRTMHKFRYRTYLWKQYLTFCIAINSKKHFYKALTNALRFLPFQLELWKIGVRYEVQIGKNKWKARKLFHKALKLVPSGQKNIELTKQLIKFELEFVQTLQMRQNIIKGQMEQGQNNMKFIMDDNNNNKMSEDQQQSENQDNLLNLANQTSELLKLKEYYQVLFVALVDSIQKNYKSKTYFSHLNNITASQRCERLCNLYVDFLSQLKDNQSNQLLQHILEQTIKKVNNYKTHLNEIKLEENYVNQQQMQIEVNQNEGQIEIEQEQNGILVQQEKFENQKVKLQNNKQKLLQKQQQSKQQKYGQEIITKYQQSKVFDEKQFIKVIKQLCLKPLQLAKFLQPLLHNCFNESMLILFKNQWLRIPLKSLKLVLSTLNSSQLTNNQNNFSSYLHYLQRQIQKINVKQYMQNNSDLLKQIIRWNRQQNKIEENNKIFRSILINCKSNIEFIERAKCMFNQ